MKRFWKIAGMAALVTLVGAVILTGVAFAQDPTPTKAIGWLGSRLAGLRDAIATKLGVEPADLDVAVQEASQEMIEQAVAEGRMTQEQADRMLSGKGFSMMRFGGGKLSPSLGRVGGMGNILDQAGTIGDQLGLTIDELRAELNAGKTLAEIAEEKGRDWQAICDSIEADRIADRIEASKAAIQQALAAGKITQAEADWRLQGLEQGFTPMGRGFAGRGRHFGGFRCPLAP